MLPRLRWLAPARLAEDAETMTVAQLNSRLNEHFSLDKEALLVFEMARSTTGEWQEISRGFVVCETWPVLDIKNILQTQAATSLQL